jgi:nucleotide-binding universal stress UspA family protein
MILEAADQFGADLLIVGSHGRGFWGRLTLGSVSDAVVHHAKYPVLVVRTGPAK